MQLSIIIVNYNVEYFLEQCLHSVRAAMKNLEAEVFVVDNNSVDGSVEMVRNKFPEVKLIANKENLGFSKANNQAIRQSTGKYVLLLNPDTVVEADTFTKCVAFMDLHSDAGGLGIKMLDGKGNFLPESKRGLPTPMVAFYKIFGLSALFPKSKRFGKYHLGFLDKEETNEVEILSGAYMLMRKEALDKVGLLDEDFFMYGEDIDLSYRIIKGGWKNYYYPEARIIHYKGESTKKSSVNFVFVFYNAMIIFARKHFSQQNAKTFSFLINIAIYIRAGAAILRRFVEQIFVPAIDSLLLFSGLYFIANYWEETVKAVEGVHYPPEFLFGVLPLYIIVWLFSVFLSAGYDKPVKASKIVRGIFIGTAVILVIYALLPETYRFSRALILLGTLWAIFSMLALRLLFHLLKVKGFDLGAGANKRIVIVGKQDEAKRVGALLNQAKVQPSFSGFIYPSEIDEGKSSDYIGTLDQLSEIIDIYKINEVIFCAKDLPSNVIIDKMSAASNSQVDYKIAPPESLYIIGSNSINSPGELYVIDINSISKKVNKRNKRMLDLIVSFVLLSLFPVLLFIVDKPFGLIKNCMAIFLGKKSWVGYYFPRDEDKQIWNLPKIKDAVLNPLDAIDKQLVDTSTIQKLNMLYAKDYRLWNDINIVWKGLREMGRSTQV
ncbi:MAG: glycosyltransferase family 2 protein [Bacteroidia bacterium]